MKFNNVIAAFGTQTIILKGKKTTRKIVTSNLEAIDKMICKGNAMLSLSQSYRCCKRQKKCKLIREDSKFRFFEQTVTFGILITRTLF